jgi:hypothetical protein
MNQKLKRVKNGQVSSLFAQIVAATTAEALKRFKQEEQIG